MPDSQADLQRPAWLDSLPARDQFNLYGADLKRAAVSAAGHRECRSGKDRRQAERRVRHGRQSSSFRGLTPSIATPTIGTWKKKFKDLASELNVC
jgi:hypothetical protein